MAKVIPKRLPTVREVKRFDAIIGADVHLREDCPACREPEEFFTAQKRKVGYIRELCEESRCPFLVAGDLFDYWKPSPALLRWALEALPETVAVPGQHDLRNHELASLPETGLGVLQAGGRVFSMASSSESALEGYKPIYIPCKEGAPWIAYGLGWGQTPKQLKIGPDEGRGRILLWHHLTCEREQPWPGAGAARAVNSIVQGFDVTVTGDNHQQFLVKGDRDKFLLNPGSMMRTDAGQVDFQPAVWGWEAWKGLLTRIPLPIEKGAVKTGHLGKETREERDRRMDAYVKKAKRQFEARLSFTRNLESHFRANREPKGVERAVWEAVGKEDGE